MRFSAKPLPPYPISLDESYGALLLVSLSAMVVCARRQTDRKMGALGDERTSKPRPIVVFDDRGTTVHTNRKLDDCSRMKDVSPTKTVQ